MPSRNRAGSAEHWEMHESLLEKKRLLDSELVLTLARDLLSFEESEGFKTPGYESMAKYCTGALHLGPSTTRYYLQIAKFIKARASRVSWEEWVSLGPTKIRVLASRNPTANELPGLIAKYISSEISTRKMEAQLLPNRAKRRRKR
jgi:hypothetical protein